MAFTKLTGNLSNVSELPDRPNDSAGMDAEALKAVFDAAGNAIQTYLNTVLIPELEGSTAAGNLGIAPITGLTDAADVQAALEALLEAIGDIEAGSVTDSSITTAKLADLAVTTAKLAAAAVTTAKLADGAVTAAKLGALAVETAKLNDRAVTGGKIALAAVANENLGAKAVKGANIDDAAVDTAQLKDSAVTFAKTSGVQKEIKTATGTLVASGWSNKTYALTVSGMTATCEFVAAPNTASGWAAAADAMLYPPTAGAGTLTFTCEDTPSVDIPVTVYYWEA